MSGPDPRHDPTVWREHGDPLVRGADEGPLARWGIAVKDLYGVRGHRTGAGNPTWLAESAPAERSATVVQQLLDAGADVTGLAVTDELAYSLAGTNAHTGTPPNPAAPGRVPGGSSSGSAAAVALGQARVGLGTDTGGSVRVPAAYQGLFGIRTTHDLLPRDGLLALAPSFDSVGWLTRDAADLQRVGDVLLPPEAAAAGSASSPDLVLVPALLAMADDDVARAVGASPAARAASPEDWDLGALPSWRAAFQTWQGWEAWRAHGDWLTGRLDVLGADVRGRFETASQVTEEQAADARALLDTARRTLRDLVGDRVLVLPSAPTIAPALGEGLAERLSGVREATMTLTCLAGIAGLPAVSIPTTTEDGLPCGTCLVAAPGRDRDLLDLALDLALAPADDRGGR